MVSRRRRRCQYEPSSNPHANTANARANDGGVVPESCTPALAPASGTTYNTQRQWTSSRASLLLLLLARSPDWVGGWYFFPSSSPKHELESLRTNHSFGCYGYGPMLPPFKPATLFVCNHHSSSRAHATAAAIALVALNASECGTHEQSTIIQYIYKYILGFHTYTRQCILYIYHGMMEM